MSADRTLQLKKKVAPFETSNVKRSLVQILNTVPPFILLWFLAYQSLAVTYWLTLAISVAAAGFAIRIFILFHDCCHYALFKNRRVNEIIGTITGMLTFTPYRAWQHSHAIHHATSSNLNKRGIGDIRVMTVEEYTGATFGQRLAYRLYRNPLIMFGLGPFYSFLLANRFNRRGAKRKEKLNTYLTNAGIVALVALLCWAVGWQAFLLVHLPIFYFSSAFGIWMFYVQHQFEDTYFENEEEWDFVQAAVEGSSYYKLPRWLQWVTGNIGFHHVHHLSPRVPNYNLEQAHEQTPDLHKVTTITLRSSLQALSFRLWDERNKRFVGFREIRSRSSI